MHQLQIAHRKKKQNGQSPHLHKRNDLLIGRKFGNIATLLHRNHSTPFGLVLCFFPLLPLLTDGTLSDECKTHKDFESQSKNTGYTCRYAPGFPNHFFGLALESIALRLFLCCS
jgi:hypothetical protein